ncbi:ZIP-like iron-zinc transporter [Hysterangium stoloniferum]|nr:ZIP-like iron-zinc transporter [Hysterangium stoloniferum]
MSTECGRPSGGTKMFGLRVASLFVILVTSTMGALFPVLLRRSRTIRVPPGVFDFAKHFGSGVIIATAFIHLLSPALDALGSPCLGAGWQTYPWALAISMASVFGIFFLELAAFRWGSAKLASIGKKAYGPHGHDLGHEDAHRAHGSESVTLTTSTTRETAGCILPTEHTAFLDTAIAQIVGIAILEFGVVFHSILIGLTLAVDPGFKILFVVLAFHQVFEGLGLGTRLAFMDLPGGYNWVPITGAVVYGCSTPLGIAIGLGMRTSYDPDGPVALIVSGILDSISSGILLYTGLVELLAHEFLFNPAMRDVSNQRLVFSSCSVLFGAGIMAFLGRWA